MPKQNYDRIFNLYQLAIEQLRHEADAIWSRFNILFSVDAAMLAVYSVLHRALPTTENPFVQINNQQASIAMLVLGISFSFMAVLQMERSWKWRDHWYNKAVDLESLLGADGAEPVTMRFLLQHTPPRRSRPVARHATHQNFFWVFFFLWIALLAIKIWKG